MHAIFHPVPTVHPSYYMAVTAAETNQTKTPPPLFPSSSRHVIGGVHVHVVLGTGWRSRVARAGAKRKTV